MLDYKVTFKVINLKLMEVLNALVIKLVKLIKVSLINNRSNTITNYTLLNVLIGGILYIIPAFLFSPSDINIILSNN